MLEGKDQKKGASTKMKTIQLKHYGHFSIISLLFLISIIIFSLITAASAHAKSAKEIDASVDDALGRFYGQVKDAKAFAQKAAGLLVLPKVAKGALIVGGEYGKGALRIGGKTVDYYSMMAGSIGLQIGGQAKDVIIAFMSDKPLNDFRASKGWEAGVDGNVALVTLGTGESAMTAMNKGPIVAFVFDVKGLMVDMSIKGAKFNKLDREKLK
jgi:lipid-binding SYLF domain-containing protein